MSEKNTQNSPIIDPEELFGNFQSSINELMKKKGEGSEADYKYLIGLVDNI